MQGMDTEAARDAYMKIIKDWDGFGSNLFEVEQQSNKVWPKELWLAINLNGIGIYPRGR